MSKCEQKQTVFKGMPCLKCGNTERYTKGTKQCVACAKIAQELWRLKTKNKPEIDFCKKKKKLCVFCKEIKTLSRFSVKSRSPKTLKPKHSSTCKQCVRKKAKIDRHYLSDRYIKQVIRSGTKLKSSDITSEMIAVRRQIEMIKRATK